MNAESSGLIVNWIVQPQRISLTSECLRFPVLSIRVTHMPQSTSARVEVIEPVLHESALSVWKAKMLYRSKAFLHYVRVIVLLGNSRGTRKTYLLL